MRSYSIGLRSRKSRSVFARAMMRLAAAELHHTLRSRVGALRLLHNGKGLSGRADFGVLRGRGGKIVRSGVRAPGTKVVTFAATSVIV
jgi:hypothetical protein